MNTLARHLRVLLALFLCLGLSTGIAFLPLAGWNWLPNLALALVMSGLIALFFMRVRYSEPLIALTSVVGLLWLSLFFFLIMLDYLSRPWPR
jgi:caa(3)-type oxidase subunit IV